MNKAFAREDDAGEAPVVPPRAPLPDGVPNYVTARGLALLRAEKDALEEHRVRWLAEGDGADRRRELAVTTQRLAQLVDRLAAATVVPPPAAGTDRVRFGATVRVRDVDGTEREVRIVGVDEADPTRGTFAFTSPVARALIGREVGDEVTVATPRGDQPLEIVSVG